MARTQRRKAPTMTRDERAEAYLVQLHRRGTPITKALYDDTFFWHSQSSGEERERLAARLDAIVFLGLQQRKQWAYESPQNW